MKTNIVLIVPDGEQTVWKDITNLVTVGNFDRLEFSTPTANIILKPTPNDRIIVVEDLRGD